MRTVTQEIYTFSELSEEGKKKAGGKLADINVDYEWWQFTYDDAKAIGLKITSFDLDRNKGAEGKFLVSGSEVCDKIMKEHGEECDTYKSAVSFLRAWNELVKKHSDGVNTELVAEENQFDFDKEADELEQDFLDETLENYASILQKEYDYLCSEEAIIETIEANKYEFTAAGELF